MEQHHDKVFGQCYVGVKVKQKWGSPYPTLTFKIRTLAKLICAFTEIWYQMQTV